MGSLTKEAKAEHLAQRLEDAAKWVRGLTQRARKKAVSRNARKRRAGRPTACEVCGGPALASHLGASRYQF